jgi:LAO/AO transport system kinase
VVVVLVPEAGDAIQMMKAGLMEIGDVFIVNKADREGADRLAREIKFMLTLKTGENSWEIPVVLTRAHESQGIEEVVKEIENHRSFQTESGLLREKREIRREEELSLIISEIIESKISEKLKEDETEKILIKVKKGEIDPYEGAELIISKVLHS